VSGHSDSDGMGSIPASHDARNVPLLLCQERCNEASLPGSEINAPNTPTYHKLISNNLNAITFMVTDDNTAATAVNGRFANNITFAIVLHIIDYADPQNTF
jgi:hypothetical protein